MPGKSSSAEQIVTKAHQVDVFTAQGNSLLRSTVRHRQTSLPLLAEYLVEKSDVVADIQGCDRSAFVGEIGGRLRRRIFADNVLS